MDRESRVQVEQIGEEYLERRQKGDYPAIDEYEAKHPELAKEIRRFIEALDVVEEFKSFADYPQGEESSAETTEFPLVDDYQVLKKIGQGGMGIVYEARHTTLDRHVALKILPGGWVNNEVAVQRFLREAKSAAALHHTNIVPVFDVGSRENLHYYAMQLISGSPLNDVIGAVRDLRGNDSHQVDDTDDVASGVTKSYFLETGNPAEPNTDDTGFLLDEQDQPASTGKSNATTDAIRGSHAETTKLSGVRGSGYHRGCARIGLQVAEALAYAHDHGIVHRDIKPSNLILDYKGNVWVTDFGLARSEDDQLTRTGDVVGTLRYMSPERLQGKNDARSDIYALGMTLYEMIALKPALEATDQVNLLKKIPSTDPARLKTIDSQVPRDLETIVHKAINKDPARRYTTAAEMADDLERFIDGLPITARRVSPWERLGLWARKNRAIAALLVTLIAGLLITTVGATTAAFIYRDMAEKQTELTEEANESAHRANSVRDLFIDSFNNADADHGGKAVTVYDSLSQSLDEIRSSAEDDPATAAALLSSIAQVFESLGLYQESLDVSREAATIALYAAGPTNYDTISYEIQVARNLNSLGRDDESFAMFTDLSTRAKELNHQLQIISNIGEGLVQQQEFDNAIEILLPALAKSETAGEEYSSLGLDGHTTLSIMASLMDAYRHRDLDEAIRIADVAYQRCLERDGPGGFFTNYYRNGLMSVLHEDGQFDRVLPIMEEISAEFRESLGDDHPHAIISTVNLAVVSASAGRLQRAIEICEETAPLAHSRGIESREYRYLSRVLAQFQVRAGNYDESYPLNWLNSMQSTVGFGNAYEKVTVNAFLAICALENDRIEDAISFAQNAIDREEEEEDPNHQSFLLAKSTLGSALARQESLSIDELEQAQTLLEDSFRTLWEDFDSVRAGEHWYLTRMCKSVIDFHEQQNRPDQVEFWTNQADVVATRIAESK